MGRAVHADHEVADAAWGDPEPAPIEWRSGRWSLELRGDELADLRVDGALVVRSIRFVARDRDWNTVPAVAVAPHAGDDRLDIELRLEGYGARIAAHLGVAVEGDRLRVAARAEVADAWSRNRLGLVLLHPPSVAGSPLRVEHPDGGQERTAFPKHIAPHQPAKDIAALGWTAHSIELEARFEGDAFEMEDQRNWTDASFKTYSTPLALPFPVELAAGTVVEQAIELTARGRATAIAPADGAPLEFRPSGSPFPVIGLGAANEPGAAPPVATPVGLHLVELDLAGPGWRGAMDRALGEAAVAGAAADVRLITTEVESVAPAVAALAGRDVVRLGVTHARSQVTEPELWAALVTAARAFGIRAHLVAGARSHFTELNRRIADLPADAAALTFALTPQMHATERAQLVESLAMQRLVARDAVRLADGRPVHVGPVTLRSRYNTVATTSAPPSPPDVGFAVAPDAGDPRQSSTALAAWTVASAAALAVDGVASIVYFETWGPRGVRAADGTPYPVAEAVAALAALSGAERLDVAGDPPSGVWIAAARRAGVDTALLANLTAQTVVVPVARAGDVKVGPFSVARRDIAAGHE